MKVLMISNPSEERCDMLRALGYDLVFDTSTGIRGNTFENIWIDELIETPPTSSLQDIAEVMKDMEVTHGVASDNVYEVVTPLWSWKLSRKQVEYLIDGFRLTIEPTIFTEPKKLNKPRQSIPFWANDYRRK